MTPPGPGHRLSNISTVWTLLQQAHAGPAADAAAAQQQLMERYGGAVRRYLLAALRDPHAADDLAQEFALSLVRGEFRRADPDRGRFRDYVKSVLFHLVSKHRKVQRKQPRPASPAEPAAPPDDPDREFNESWRAHLLERAWQALSRSQPAYHEVLRFRSANPKMPSAQMALELTRQLGRPLTADGVRQTLRRARSVYVDLLMTEVVESLEEPTAERVGDELRDLNLLGYCEPLLKKRFPGSA
jgi:RNA polymerase sigma-70 factor (ECF subfamily)